MYDLYLYYADQLRFLKGKRWRNIRRSDLKAPGLPLGVNWQTQQESCHTCVEKMKVTQPTHHLSCDRLCQTLREKKDDLKRGTFRNYILKGIPYEEFPLMICRFPHDSVIRFLYKSQNVSGISPPPILCNKVHLSCTKFRTLNNFYNHLIQQNCVESVCTCTYNYSTHRQKKAMEKEIRE